MQQQLEIQNYFIEEISLKTNKGFDRSKTLQAEVAVSCEIQQRKDDNFRYRIGMEIKVDVSPGAQNVPYNIHLIIVGFFHFDNTIDQETIDRMLVNNGTSIVYGLARGIVAQVSANGPNGKFILPIMNLIPAIEQAKKDKTKDSKKKPSKRNLPQGK